MTDYQEGIKKEVAEVKFLIHDLRVERFFNEVIHFHVTLDTDLEIHGLDQAKILHGEDLQVLKAKAVSLRKAFQDYSNAVKNFSPGRTVLLTGNNYIGAIRSTCELILNPLWGRIDKVLAFLPPESRSARSRGDYRNCIHWIRGVSRRIDHFLDEKQNKDVYHEFDLGEELDDFTRNVILGYVAEKSGAKVELKFDGLDSAIICGNRYRFRRMYFNLVMNSVDAMDDRKAGVVKVSDTIEGDRVLLRVHDNGSGMPPEKIAQLLTDKETLDGELHSLGFVFVRQTIAQFEAELAIDSQVGEGTTVTVSFPRLPGQKATSPEAWERVGDDRLPETDNAPPETAVARAKPAPEGNDNYRSCGQTIFQDYHSSEADHPGCIFAISITDDDTIDFFTHRPYDRYWNMSHEDLSPMYFEATVRGRLEEDDQKQPALILKQPQSVKEYFEFKNVPEKNRTAERHVQMVHDEYIRIARKLIDTGLSPQVGTQLTGLQKIFPGRSELPKTGPFPLQLLARQPLTTERSK
jgi:hypothetical protein